MAQDIPPLTYELRSRETYKVLEGDSDTTHFDPERLTLDFPEIAGPFPGVFYRGSYREQNAAGEEIELPVISFLYHKLDAEGQLETKQRMVIWRGFGLGVHPGHTGQPPSWYFVGPQIGSLEPISQEVTSVPAGPETIDAKHFSLNCVTDGPWGDLVLLANPS